MGMTDVGRFFLEKIRNISLRADCRVGHRLVGGRRFAAEIWVMPEDDPPDVSTAQRFISRLENGEGFLAAAL
jgi:hypothetical protein